MRCAAGLLLLGLALPAECDSEYPFGKIFSAPEQRRILDEYRRSGKAQEPEESDAQQDGDVRATDQVRFSGYVIRSDGRQTVWVDGSSDIGAGGGAAGASHDNVRAQSGSAVFSARQSRAALKPGQTWMLNQNQVLESYEAPTGIEPAGEPADEGSE